MQLHDFLTIIWKRRLMVALVFVCCVGAATAYAVSQPKRYETSATIAFTPNPRTGNSYLPSENLAALLSTYAEVAKSDQTRAAARAILGHAVPGTVSTSTSAGSGILQIFGKDTSPLGAEETASAIARAFVHSIENNALLVPSIVNPPVISYSPVQPRPTLIISVAAVIGLIAGILLALSLKSFQRTVESPVELAELTGLPVIGEFVQERALAKGSSLVWSSPNLGLAQEAYRALRTNVEMLIEERSAVIQVTSAVPGEGKSTTVANLAIALGQLDIPTTIVDADLHDPSQHRIFGLKNEVGLSTAMMLGNGDVSPQPAEFDNVSVLTSGPILPNAPEMLHIRFRAILRELRAHDGVVLIDSPPVLPVSDSPLIAPQADAVLFVVAAGRTHTSAVSSALERLRFVQATVIGLVLTFAHRDNAAGGYHYGGYRETQHPGPVPTS
jgi:succinoglycan biosynthesis transport protein ExoP